MNNFFSIAIMLFFFFGAFGALKFLLLPMLLWYAIKFFLPHNILNANSMNWNEMFQKMNQNMNNFGKNQNFYEHFQYGGQQYKQQKNRQTQGDSYMSLEEARKILNVDDRASRAEIQKSYHQLMKKVHPDMGGSQYLATKINKAKEILLDHHK